MLPYSICISDIILFFRCHVIATLDIMLIIALRAADIALPALIA